jgi:uncharacterized membrane protein YfcA
LTALAAGFIEALTGLGGGVVLVTALTLLFHVDKLTRHRCGNSVLA